MGFLLAPEMAGINLGSLLASPYSNSFVRYGLAYEALRGQVIQQADTSGSLMTCLEISMY